MVDITVLDEKRRIVIGGATIYDYNDLINPSLVGSTNSSGVFTTHRSDLKNLRVEAHGYTFDDYKPPRSIATDLSVLMKKIHPGAYTGYLGDASKATWESKKNGLVFQFESRGYFRYAKTIREIRNSTFKKFELTEGNVWSELKTGITKFPTTSALIVDHYFYSFLRFPEPGKMIAKKPVGSKDIVFVKLN